MPTPRRLPCCSFDVPPSTGRFAGPRAGRPKPGAPRAGPAPYDVFVQGRRRLVRADPVVRKAGKVFLVISISQFDKDFIETVGALDGLGGFGPAKRVSRTSRRRRIMRFQRVDEPIVIRWPNTFAKVDQQTAQAARRANLPTQFVVAGGTGRRQSKTRGRLPGAFLRMISRISRAVRA